MIIRPVLICTVLRILIAGLLPLVMISLPAPVAAADDDQPQYYELRTYLTQSADQRQRINDYWQNAAIPAYNRMGIQPVGVFTEIRESATNNIYVLIPCDSLEIFVAIPAKLAATRFINRRRRDSWTRPKPTRLTSASRVPCWRRSTA